MQKKKANEVVEIMSASSGNFDSDSQGSPSNAAKKITKKIRFNPDSSRNLPPLGGSSSHASV